MRFPVFLLLIIGCWGTTSVASELKPFRAEYVAEFQGLPVKARGTRTLELLGDNRYRLSSSADSLMVKVLEFSEFTIEGEQLIPIHYQYERKGIGRNKFEASEFDWDSALVTHDEGQTLLLPQTLDKLSYQYQLRMDVAAAINEGTTEELLSYIIADEEKRKEYVFRIAGTETLSTPIGDLETIRVERIHDEPDDQDEPQRSTAMWLSGDHDYVLVRLLIEEGKRGFELNLDHFEAMQVAAD